MREVHPLDFVETIRKGVRDADLMVRFANRSASDAFAVTPEDAAGEELCELGNRHWDIPELCSVIETVLPERATIEAFDVDHVLPSMGRRVRARSRDKEGLL